MITILLLILSTILNRRGITCKPQAKKIEEAWSYVREQDMNQRFCILIDYSLHSGSNRLWVWDFENKHILFECPVAHGRGKGKHLRRSVAKFSNEEDTWLSSLGKCQVAERYHGRFGISYRLDGLDDTNSNIRKRCIVLHSYYTVPPKPSFPLPSGRSKGCVQVAKRNMDILDKYLQNQDKVLMLIYA